MRKLCAYVLLFAMVSLQWSCSSESDDPGVTGITMDGKKIQVSVAQLLRISGTENNYTFSLSDASDISNVKTVMVGVTFPLEATVTGNYNYPENGERVLLGISNYSILNATQTGSLLDGTGLVSITDNSNNNYTLSLNLTMGDGTVIKGTHKGTFLTQ